MKLPAVAATAAEAHLSDVASNGSSAYRGAYAAPAEGLRAQRADTFPDRDQQHQQAHLLMLQRGALPAGSSGPLAYGSNLAGVPRPGAHMFVPPACIPAAPPSTRGAPADSQQQAPSPPASGGGAEGCGAEDLPESTPAPIADPAEAVMLEKYLQLVRETQGTEAAAVAAASSAAGGAAGPSGSGAPPPVLASSYGYLPAPASCHSSRPPSRSSSADALQRMQQQLMGATAPCGFPQRSGADSGSESSGPVVAAGGGREVVSSMLGFIRERKLATNNPPQRRLSVGSSENGGSSASSASGNKSNMKIWIQPSGVWCGEG
jgi:hypothetical protein